ncbi:MAG: replication-associated recombination protein A [Acidobacteriota bacterium]|nr:MAG: replication-associated recombination protein A [Acidobacteriota bacterium]
MSTGSSGSLFPGPPLLPDAPLAERMRPRSLAEIVGQRHLVGEDGFLHRLINGRQLSSLILWGPPGSGKTTLARLLARAFDAELFSLSAVSSGVKDVREMVERARRLRAAGQRSLLFIDEIHRFHKGQQDALLPHLEDGTITLVGATTENPAHTVIAPLVSRCRVLVLEPLAADEIVALLERALSDRERGLGQLPIRVVPEIVRAIAEEAEGDARRALTSLELAVSIARSRAPEGGLKAPLIVDAADARQAAQQRLLRADRQGDVHYDLASAFIKSMRGSDPDAAVYYLMRMIESGEDPRFAARRMIIFAAEDIGLADPHALPLAVSAAQAFERLGLPEGSLPLAEAALYLATAPKSNSVILARDHAAERVRQTGSLAIPSPLLDASAPSSRVLGRGRGYRYPHAEPGHHAAVDYLPDELAGERYYDPSDQGREREVAERLDRWRKAVARGRKNV